MATEISSPQILELLKRNQSKNGQEPLITGDDLQALIDNPKIWRAIAKNVEQEPKPEKPTFPPPTIKAYKVKIRHGDSQDKRIKAGRYDWKNDWISQDNTPIVVNKAKGTEDKEVFTFHFGRYMTSEQVVEAMAAEGYKPVEHEDLLAFGADHPEVQREFPIAQLGSSWVRPGRGRVVSYLGEDGRERHLNLRSWVGEWRRLPLSRRSRVVTSKILVTWSLSPRIGNPGPFNVVAASTFGLVPFLLFGIIRKESK